jgi:adenylate cyclase
MSRWSAPRLSPDARAVYQGSAVMKALERAIALGTDGELASSDARRVRLCNLSALLGAATTLGFTVGFAIAGARSHAAILVVNLVNALLMLAALAWNARRRHRVARVWIMAVVNLHIAAASFLASRQAGFHIYFFLFPPVTLLLMPGRVDRVPRWALTALSAILYLLAEHHPAWEHGHLPIPGSVYPLLRGVAAVLNFGTLVFVVYQFYVDTLRAEDELAREHERSEGLLRNILPAPIARRLKSDAHSIAEGFAEVSVLFADLVGFTGLSSRLPPAQLVELLNRVFSELDDLTERRGLEKIKTIGDAYMVAAGLPEPRPDHAHALVRFALDMLEVVERVSRDTGHPLSIRIGIHTGPVVAGVIGKRKFIYDLWGDTVNVASRMESHGVAGGVHVTAEVARRVGDAFELSEPRTITVKGKGEMVTHLVLGGIAGRAPGGTAADPAVS